MILKVNAHELDSEKISKSLFELLDNQFENAPYQFLSYKTPTTQIDINTEMHLPLYNVSLKWLVALS